MESSKRPLCQGAHRGGIREPSASQGRIGASAEQIRKRVQEGGMCVVCHMRAAQQRRPPAYAVALVHRRAAPLHQEADTGQLHVCCH